MDLKVWQREGEGGLMWDLIVALYLPDCSHT
jgi:hypothetical protein